MNVFRKVAFTNIKSLINCNKRILPSINLQSTRYIQSSPTYNGLNEFFDDEKNWGVTEVKSGRSWTLDELRIKSNTDLHKLWYILLKEKNMLLTMEEASKAETRLFPSPERLDKVEMSMENIEAVVKERNTAYHLLETGKSGVRETKPMTSPLGLEVQHTEEEHLIPKEQNTEWLKEHTYDPDDSDVKKFRVLMREKEAKELKKKKTRDFNHVIGLLNRYPNLDLEAIREQYPDVDIEKAKRSRKYRGHFVPDMYNLKQ